MKTPVGLNKTIISPSAMNNPGLTITEIRLASKRATVILANAGYSCCLVGSAAGYEHGITRIPNDVDILVMTEKEPVELKNLLVSEDSSFYWAKSTTNPQACYRILWYRLPVAGDLDSPEKNCRIDLFTPGMIHLPRIHIDRIVWSESGLPIMPLFPIILHKIQAWKAHLASTKPWAGVKQANDINDIKDLLRAAEKANVSLGSQNWLDPWFLEEAVEGVREYIQQYLDTADGWVKLGFRDVVMPP
ncbi:hypothetical protein D9756_005807 [Leucocoprinus leucothites]|uniref:Uncharacterized protein n=1 Tax=Leucocoprinus leucothites TaxID=201217 RepID=A0A8H5D2E2_9AGAR|nr:hypothetical protein D9756_005807 [Leucoagaricus leucothites]